MTEHIEWPRRFTSCSLRAVFAFTLAASVEQPGLIKCPAFPLSLLSSPLPGQAFSDMLRENKSLKGLNLESNFITSAGVQALVEALRDNDTLTEIKIDNQVWTSKSFPIK